MHTHAGEVVVLERWSVDRRARIVSGAEIRYDVARQRSARAAHRIGFDAVALLATNEPRTVLHTGLPLVGRMVGSALVGASLCMANPKARFGS
jgi:hypothetical protein